MMLDLFPDDRQEITLAEGAVIFRGFAGAYEIELMTGLSNITAIAPFRHMVTPGGFRMSVAMTNCGQLGWVTDRSGCRYSSRDPLSGKPWPELPQAFLELAQSAAAKAGYDDFHPTSCLINQYEPGAKLSLHQDKDETDRAAPIVSVSLGIPAMFQFGGLKRSDPIAKHRLEHGDVVVWGGKSRLAYHGILPLKPDEHPILGSKRINLTFRKAV